MSRRRHATILLVDDDVAFGGALRTLLEADGHAVHQVLDGEEALRRASYLGSDLNLILLDLLLPKKTGFDVVKELAERASSVPILVMTGVYAEASQIHALRVLGVSGWIHKTAPFDQFLFRVNGLLHPPRESTRATPRVVARLPVSFVVDERTCHATSYNLSASGIYVRTPDDVTVGDVLEMTLTLPTATEPVTVQAEVMHAATADEVRGTAYPAGFGARFVDLTPLASTAIRGLVDALLAEERTGLLPAAVEPVSV